jgi:hypothetical protein
MHYVGETRPSKGSVLACVTVMMLIGIAVFQSSLLKT